MKRGQISVEYLIIVGFVVFVVIGLLAVAIFYTTSSRERIKSNQLRNFADKVTSSAEFVFFSGEPSQATISAYLPSGVQSIEIIDDNIVFNITTNAGNSVIAYPSEVPIEIQGQISLNEGLKRLKIVSSDDLVLISES